MYIFILDYRDIANRVTSNECRLVCIPDTWLKIAQEHSARVGLSEYVYQNAQDMFPTNFPKTLSTKKMVISRGSGVKKERGKNLNLLCYVHVYG